MADENAQVNREGLEEEVRSAIAAFEQILEAMPDDRASLEALASAYGQIGDGVKARAYLLRLIQVLIDEGDVAGVGEHVEGLQALGPEDKEAVALLRKVEALQQGGASGADVEAPQPVAGAAAADVSLAVDMAAELAFAWGLMERGDLTEDDYAAVVQDLTEMTASDSASSVSLLHVLEARHFKGIERVVAGIARTFGTPYVSLDVFDIDVRGAAILPLDFTVRRGAVVFEVMASHALVAVMNPLDKGLRRDVERLAQRPCHYYITMASEFDRAVGRIMDAAVESEES